MRVLFLLLVSGLCLGRGSLVRGDDSAVLKPLIERGLESAGGRETLAKRNVQVLRYTMVLPGAGEERTIPGRAVRQIGQRLRVELEKVVTIGYDGTKGWMSGNGMVVDLMGEQVRQLTDQIRADAMVTLISLGDEKLQLRTLGESRVEDQPVVGFRIEQDGHRPVELYLDKETGLVVRRITEVPSMQTGQFEKEETLYRNYKPMDGIKTPLEIETRRDGKVLSRLKISDAKYHEQVEAAEFRRPAS